MTTQKILQINPELFKFNRGKKSLRQKEKKTRPIQDKTQSLKSNKLKRELLKKVKDYQKNKETEVINDEKKREKNENNPGSNLFDSKDFENNDFEREFNKSLTFLHDLSKKNKDKNKKKTFKLSNADINIEIPKDSLIYNSKQEPNYGCLKNGSKPTFRDLNKTQKHSTHNNEKRLKLALENNTFYDHSEFHSKYQTNDNITTESNKPNIELKISEELITTNNPSTKNTNFMPLSSNKLNNKLNNEIITASYDYNNYSTNTNTNTNTNKEEVLTKEVIAIHDNIHDNKDDNIRNNIHDNKDDNKDDNKEVITKEDNKDDSTNTETYIPKLRRITRTFKYNLGKKKDAKHIGLLIKNRDTQKKIKQEVAQLKQQPIQDVKNFLREKNLIKLGSQAPNDVLRKLYEDTVLAGEITNTNTNNLVHNYLNDV